MTKPQVTDADVDAAIETWREHEAAAWPFPTSKGCIRRVLEQYEASRAAPAPQGELVAWRWRPKGATGWIYDPKPEWLEAQSDDIDKEPLFASAPAVPDPVETERCPDCGGPLDENDECLWIAEQRDRARKP